MEEPRWTYERLDENGKLKTAPTCDFDGSVTGQIVIGVKAYFDENPEERKRLGWTKHIIHRPKDFDIEYDPATQYLSKTVKQVDEWTVEDEYIVLDKSEERMRIEETAAGYGDIGGTDFFFFADDFDE